LDDLSTLTEFDVDDWQMHYQGQTRPWSEETFAELVPLTPDAYRREHEEDLNEMRVAAGLDTRRVYTDTAETRALKAAAGIL
jgi:hypothetical protein